MKILLVDDDKLLAKALTEHLTQHNFVVDTVNDGETGLYYASNFIYDLILLDILIPDLDGISLCKKLRDRGCMTPIILLTARYNSSIDKIKGLNAGADDYILKPVDFQELIARIRAILRRETQNLSSLLEWGSLSLDPASRKVKYQERDLNLTPKQYALLELFLRNQGRVFSPAAIIDSLWSSEEIPGEDTVRTHIKELRQKLQTAGLPKNAIETIYGQGYCLKPLAVKDPDPIELREKKDWQQAAALSKIWQEYKQAFIDRLEVFEEVKHHLELQGTLNPNLQQKAESIAHKLAGTLGSFGKQRGSQLAIELERLLQVERSFGQKKEKQFLHLLSALRAEIENPNLCLEKSQTSISTKSKQISDRDSETIRLLIINSNCEFIRSLSHLARKRGIKVATAATARAALEILARDKINIAILQLNFKDNPHLQEDLKLIESLREFTAEVPLLIVADRGDFRDRIEVMQRGGNILLVQPITPSFAIETIEAKLDRNFRAPKIMFVDDDRELLDCLSNLLSPWNFEVTTLNDPTKFWRVLVEVNPDLLILDLEMPQVNGILLCRMVRSDPRWTRLPILFLTVNQNPHIQDLIFTSGADDLIFKPVLPERLANRIVNRLNRV